MAEGFTVTDADDGSADDPAAKGRRNRREKLALVLSDVDLWRGQDGAAYASVPNGKRREHVPVFGRDFRVWIVQRYFAESGMGLSGTALSDVTRLAEARALSGGESRVTFRRWALGNDGCIYLDLGGADPARERRAVRIGPDRWDLIDEAPIAFLRAPDALPLPEPMDDEAKVEDLRLFANVETEDDLVLLWTWLVCAARPFEVRGAYPVLLIHGEQGSGKSGAARTLGELIDPSALTGRALPREERDFFVSAQNRHLVAFDNVSAVSDTFSDCLCRLATGGGFSARTLHSDADETTFALSRAVLVNGIPALLGRADLADRAISIELKQIETRRTEAELACDMKRLRPGLLGLLCDGLSAALRNLPTTHIANPPRMADACHWAEAAAQGFAIDAGRVTTAWKANRTGADRALLDGDDVAGAVVKLMTPPGASFKGTPTQLVQRLVDLAGERVSSGKLWPRNPAGMGTKLRRLGPALRAAHTINVTHGRSGSEGERFWIISKG
jgi:hypothetical protein